MNNNWLFFCLMGMLLLGAVHPSLGQEEDNQPDTTIVVDDTLRVGSEGLLGTGTPGVENAPDTIFIEKEATIHIPRKAALFSAALPGLGQIYNGKYWKVPVIYGGFAVLGYAVTYYSDQYQLMRRAFIAVRNRAPEENPLLGVRPNSFENPTSLERFVENTRRQRDFMIILTAGLYGLQIMDAIVDAHLIEFEVNDQLSLMLHPSAGGETSAPLAVPAYGLALTLFIK